MSLGELHELAGRRSVELHELNTRIALAEQFGRGMACCGQHAAVKTQRRRWQERRRGGETAGSPSSAVAIVVSESNVDDDSNGVAPAVDAYSVAVVPSHSPRIAASQRQRAPLRDIASLSPDTLAADRKKNRQLFQQQQQRRSPLPSLRGGDDVDDPDLAAASRRSVEAAVQRELDAAYARHRLPQHTDHHAGSLPPPSFPQQQQQQQQQHGSGGGAKPRLASSVSRTPSPSFLQRHGQGAPHTPLRHRLLPPMAQTPQPETMHSIAQRLLKAPRLDATRGSSDRRVGKSDVSSVVHQHVGRVIAARNRAVSRDRAEARRLVDELHSHEEQLLARRRVLEAHLVEATTTSWTGGSVSAASAAIGAAVAAGHPGGSRGGIKSTSAAGTRACGASSGDRLAWILQNSIFHELVTRTAHCTNREVERWHAAALTADLAHLRLQQTTELETACRYYRGCVADAVCSKEAYLANSSAICDALGRLAGGPAGKAFAAPTTTTTSTSSSGGGVGKKKKAALGRRVLLGAVKKLSNRNAVVWGIIDCLAANEATLDLAATLDPESLLRFDDLLTIRSVLHVSNVITSLTLHRGQMADDATCWKVIATLPRDFDCVTKVTVLGFVDRHPDGGDDDGAGEEAEVAVSGQGDSHAALAPSPGSPDTFVQFAISMARRNRQIQLFKYALHVAHAKKTSQQALEQHDVLNLADMRKRAMHSFQCLALAVHCHETLLRELLLLREAQMREGVLLLRHQATFALLAGGAVWHGKRKALGREEARERAALDGLMVRNLSLIEAELAAVMRAFILAKKFQKTPVLSSTLRASPWLMRSPRNQRSPSTKFPSTSPTAGVESRRESLLSVSALSAASSHVVADAELVDTAIVSPLAADVAVESGSADIRSVHSSSGKRPSSRLGGTAAAVPIFHMQVEPMND